jgi:hypothetical protein
MARKTFAAQQIVSLKIKGREISRIRYGDEHDDWEPTTTPAMIAAS